MNVHFDRGPNPWCGIDHLSLRILHRKLWFTSKTVNMVLLFRQGLERQLNETSLQWPLSRFPEMTVQGPVLPDLAVSM